MNQVPRTRKDLVVRTVLSVVFFSVAITANFLAGLYANERASSPVTDIVLSNTPALDIDGMFVYGTFALIAFIGLVIAARPRRAPYVLHALGIFFLVRACFVAVTHIGPFPDRVELNAAEYIARYLWGGADLFFSGHTGAPFLLALIFWRESALRHAFLLWSLFFAVVVLLGHLHYTNDVLAAFFITYAVNDIAAALFPEDHSLLYGEESTEEAVA